MFLSTLHQLQETTKRQRAKQFYLLHNAMAHRTLSHFPHNHSVSFNLKSILIKSFHRYVRASLGVERYKLKDAVQMIVITNLSQTDYMCFVEHGICFLVHQGQYATWIIPNSKDIFADILRFFSAGFTYLSQQEMQAQSNYIL